MRTQKWRAACRRRLARASGRLLAVGGQLDGDPRLPPAQRLQVRASLEGFVLCSSVCPGQHDPSEMPGMMLFFVYMNPTQLIPDLSLADTCNWVSCVAIIDLIEAIMPNVPETRQFWRCCFP